MTPLAALLLTSAVAFPHGSVNFGFLAANDGKVDWAVPSIRLRVELLDGGDFDETVRIAHPSSPADVAELFARSLKRSGWEAEVVGSQVVVYGKSGTTEDGKPRLKTPVGVGAAIIGAKDGVPEGVRMTTGGTVKEVNLSKVPVPEKKDS